VEDLLELGRVTDRRPPFKYSALARVWFRHRRSGRLLRRYLPYFFTHVPSITATSDRTVLADRRRSRHARAASRYHAPARFDDLIEAFIRIKRIGRTSMTYQCAAYRLPDDLLMVTAELTVVLVDLEARKPLPIPDGVRGAVRTFEGDDLET
jgi:hypothetical protein